MKNLITIFFVSFTTLIYAQIDYEYEITVIDSFTCNEFSQAGMFGLRAVEFNEEIHLSYLMQDTSQTIKLIYAIRNENGVTKEIIFEIPSDPWNLINSRTTLQFDEFGEPHIYVSLESDKKIYVYHKSNNEWQSSFVADYGSTANMVADPDGSNGLGIAYWAPPIPSWGVGQIAYASYNGSNWEIDHLSSSTDLCRTKPSIVNHNNKTYVAYGEGHYPDTLITRIYVKENNEWMLDFEDVNLTGYGGGSIGGLFTKLGASSTGAYLLYDLRRNEGHPAYLKNEGQGWQNQSIEYPNSLTSFVNCPNIYLDSDNTAMWVNEANGYNPNLSWIKSDGTGGLIDLPQLYTNYWLNDMVIRNDIVSIYYSEGSSSFPFNTPVTFKEIKISLERFLTGIAHAPLNFNISLEQNVPNPFSTNTTFRFSIPKSSSVQLKVYNIRGEEICTLVNEQLNRGIYEELFTLEDKKSGIYFYVLSVDGLSISRRMLFVK
ncbi:MAG: T9SS type A sorting domain-containing protein [Prolixibacteraceae bacterium]|jgi:hypothetical protein|nr:T9SS type A sorting domain-containing protein [Prolixibacteraceae bacterium]